jgi:glycosyltransferase involved in cell wall biosynthesis
MSVDITVAIPTYNGESRLPEVLDRLRSQIHTQNFSWEIIIVDNNSTDNTAKVIQAYQADWSKSFPLKYYFEAKQGAAFARRHAIEVARGTLIGFLDDDNLPASDWVAAAYEFGQKYPAAGAYGSQIHAILEAVPPDNFHRIAPFLAITERGSQPLQYEPSKKILPPSAGLVIRKQAWLDSVPKQMILTGRVSGNMLTSEDLEMLSYIQKSSWELWYNPAMQVSHKIPAWRLERSYLIPFFRGIGLSRHVTRMLSVKSWQRPIAFVAYMINDARKIVVLLLKYRLKVKTDLVTACEMQLFISSLISPFYLWRHGVLKAKN